jgi:hypothetical protein
MVASPFAFYRGAAAITASRLSATPSTDGRLQICGDCHLMNFGEFATPERKLIFDINNFADMSVMKLLNLLNYGSSARTRWPARAHVPATSCCWVGGYLGRSDAFPMPWLRSP